MNSPVLPPLKTLSFHPVKHTAPQFSKKDPSFASSLIHSSPGIEEDFRSPSTENRRYIQFSGVTNALLSERLSQAEFQQTIQKLVKTAKSEPALRIQVTSQLTAVLDQYLQGKWTEKNQPSKRAAVLKGLHEILGSPGQGNIVMAQIDSIPGDLAGNARKIMAYIDAAEAIGIDTVVFPELALMGYPIRDLIGRFPSLAEQNVAWLKEIAKRTGKTRAIVGFVEPRHHRTVGKPYFNTLGILGNGKIEGLVRKVLLPTYNEFNEDRQFESSPYSGLQDPNTLGDGSWGFDGRKAPNGQPVTIHGRRIGLTICEDIWNDKDYWHQPTVPLYQRDPYEEVAAHKPDLMINASASPSRTNKEQMKDGMLSHNGKKYGIPVVYVNRVGAVDEHSFDGASRTYDKNGHCIGRSKSFSEQFSVINPETGEGTLEPLPSGEDVTLKTYGQPRRFDPNSTADLGRTYLTIVQGIRGYFKKTGMTKAVLGLSGGLDSTLVAALLADALGPENVLGISMPSKITQKSSRNDAEILAKNLGIHYQESSIVTLISTASRAFSQLFQAIETGRPLSRFTQTIAKHFPNTKLGQALVEGSKKADNTLNAWAERWGKSNTIVNVQARMRAVILWAVSNEFKGAMPIATSDKSELYMGYATINGDMSGGFAPIADVCKTKLFALARWMNQNRAGKNAIPEAILAKKPGAELEVDPKTGQPLTAEDDLMPYEFLDETIWRVENLKQSYDEMLNNTPHPALADPKFYYEQKSDLAPEIKKAWLDKFFSKMQAAQFKWTLLPPGVIVDSGSILKPDYQFVITGRVPGAAPTPEEMQKTLRGDTES
jgi:NAD+ synthetase